jgi:signal transduction histidine kinase
MDIEPRVKILLVDDRLENLVALEAVMEDLGQDLVRATSGTEALKRVLEEDFAVILLDVKMPGMDGFETATLIRARVKSHHIPIIFMTAYDREETEVFKGYSLGAVDFLFKPIVAEVLKSKVTVFVDLHKKTEEIKTQAERLYKAEQQAHERKLAAEKQRWEAMLLRQQMEKEKEVSRQLEDNYRRLKELEALRDDLTHMIVHDLRTPLTSLLTGLQTLSILGDLNTEQEDMLSVAIQGGQRLLCMINDLLDISKMEAGSLTIERREIPVSELVDSAFYQIDALANEKRLVLKQQLTEPLPLCPCDADKLRRVLVNLLGNAIKFTPPRGTIEATARFDESKNTLLFSIRDTGEGIPAEAFERIFDKFGQVETHKTGKKMSTGLGLTFCRMAVKAHGGNIWVESEPGKGSCFSFTVPLG